MSKITTLVLAFSILEDDGANEDWAERIAAVNKYFDEQKRCGLVVPRNDDWYGGGKVLTHPLFVGSFNMLGIDGFIAHLRTIPWKYPAEVQLWVCKEEDDVFRTMFPLIQQHRRNFSDRNSRAVHSNHKITKNPKL
jgi:hypothetical protein